MKQKNKMLKAEAGAALLAALSLPLAAGTITKDMVVHLPFDNSYANTVAGGPTADQVGAPTFAAGKVGSGALSFTSKADGSEFNYATLGTPDQLNFGGSVSFSVAFWAKLGSWTGDPAFLSNKDWTGGGNVGWVIATAGDGHLQWNFKDGNNRRDFDGPAGLFTDKNWHHVVVTFDRQGEAATYVDGNKYNGTNLAPSADTVDSGLATNIGQDGNGTYTDGGGVSVSDGQIDDVAIWRRVLTGAEVAQIYASGLAGINVANVPDPSNPTVESTTPASLATGVAANSSITATIKDGSAAVETSSVVLSLNGTKVNANVSKSGQTTTVAYTPAEFLPSGLVTAQVVFGTVATKYTNTWTFTVAPYVSVPAEYATALGSASNPGFMYRAVQARGDSGLPNSTERAELQLAGELIDTSLTPPAPYVDHAIPGPVNGSYEISLVNFDVGPADVANFPGDEAFPGIPGDESNVNNFAVEILGYLELKKGMYRFVVNSDDGFQLRLGRDARDATSLILGEFSGGRGIGDTPMDAAVTADGVYAMRLIFEQGTGGGSLEFFVQDVATGEKILVNDTSNSKAVKAFRTRSGDKDLPYISKLSPTSSTGVGPDVILSATIVDRSTAVVANTVKMLLDGQAVPATVQKTGTKTVATYPPSSLFATLSKHRLTIIFGDNASPSNVKTNNFDFQIVSYKDIKLPAPLYLETFDSVAEGALPAGWSVVNYTADRTAGEDLMDPNSDSYKNWVVISRQRVIDIGTAGGWETARRLNVAPGQVVNGKVVTNLVNGNFIYAESDQRGGSQVQYLFSKEFNLTGKTNIWTSFNSIYEQNQDSMGSVEYSIDSGKTWLPILYMEDVADLIKKADGSIDGYATLIAPQGDTATYTDPDTGEAMGGYYGAFIGVATNEWANLGPYISGRINDDGTESKRVELFRLPKADNQAKVSFRFAQAGTGSWYFGIDDFGLYSITETQDVGTVAVKLDGGTVKVSWSSGATLQSADTVNGAWADVAGATSPYSVTPTVGAKFYRLKQ